MRFCRQNGWALPTTGLLAQLMQQRGRTIRARFGSVAQHRPIFVGLLKRISSKRGAEPMYELRMVSDRAGLRSSHSRSIHGVGLDE